MKDFLNLKRHVNQGCSEIKVLSLQDFWLIVVPLSCAVFEYLEPDPNLYCYLDWKKCFPECNCIVPDCTLLPWIFHFFTAVFKIALALRALAAIAAKLFAWVSSSFWCSQFFLWLQPHSLHLMPFPARVQIHVRRMQCPLFPKMYFKPLKKSWGTAWQHPFAYFPSLSPRFSKHLKIMARWWRAFGSYHEK